MATLGIVGLLVYTYSVGLALVARSDLQGDSQEPQIVERATVKGFTLEPKYKTYHTDNQQYINGNSMN